ncbi:uncharacterized protein LOC131875939 [Cryptomeria japonica]|uniref:uncharacterized protein LOC131875939 n=1 Tax=Cryptomeria japonica TaxID=3369 RepID=UPI0027D9F10B|nr:uncharacterized protein LOC131875939 [Cryptomeria japonica]
MIFENLEVTKWKIPPYPPNKDDKRIVVFWKLPPVFDRFNNSTKNKRQMTRWSTPRLHWFKLNFDGSAQSNCQVGGGVIQEHLGNTVAAYAGNLRNNTVTQAEGMALLWGLKMANSIGIKHLEIEGDSQIIIDSVKGNALVGWRVEPIMRDIRCLLVKLEDFTIRNIFREGNRAADSMAADGRLQNGLRCWRDPSLLPVTTKEILEKEKAFTQEWTVLSTQ